MRNSFTMLLIFFHHLMSHFWSGSKFCFILFALAFTLVILLVSQNIAFNVIPFYIYEAKAIKHKILPTASHALPFSNETNAIPYSSQSNTASPGGCVSYNTSTRTITVSCSNPTRLTDIANKLQDTALTKQSPDGTWLLSANLVIAKGASFSIHH